MNAYGRNLRWLAGLAVLLLVVALAACEGERTPVPSSAPVVAPTSIPLPTATPRPAPTPEPTPDYTSQAYAYAAACSNITAKFSFTLENFANNQLTWGQLVELADANIGGYSLLYPPPDLEAYNTAQINLLTALRDRALGEPSGGSIVQDIGRAMGGAVPAGGQLDAAAQQALAGFFGPQFVQAFVAQQTAVAGLSGDLQGLVTEANCTVAIG